LTIKTKTKIIEKCRFGAIGFSPIAQNTISGRENSSREGFSRFLVLWSYQLPNR